MSTNSYHYVILGAGKQGTAAAYDLALFGQPNRITIADFDLNKAIAATERVQRLTGFSNISPTCVDVTDPSALEQILKTADAALSAVPFQFNFAITRAAIASHACLCDMGGHTGVVQSQIALDAEARAAGISLVPDCGMGPGLVNTMGAYAIELLDEAEEVYIYDAGLPQSPQPPWNYELTFHINGLTNEMDGQAIFIREGKICYVDTLSEREVMEFPGLGTLEADVTSGGTSLAPWTYLGKLKTYENKVFRYPGHFEWLKAFKTLGLFSTDPIHIANVDICPRQVYHALLEPRISRSEVHDVCVMRAVAKGRKQGVPATVTIDLTDYFDPKTAFTAMERLTGWHCAIMLALQAQGKIPPGAHPVELAVPASQFMYELARRGITHQVRWA